MIWRRVTLDYPPNGRIIESSSLNVRIAPNFFWNDVKWRKRNKNTSNQCVLVCFTAFFPHKTSNFNEFEQKWPGWPTLKRCYTHIYWNFFFAVFARTRGIYLRMIMPSDFFACNFKWKLGTKNSSLQKRIWKKVNFWPS